MKMNTVLRNVVRAVIATAVLGVALTGAFAAEPEAEKIDLRDGSTLFLHPDGTSRMVDSHGKPMEMRDGVEMTTSDGRVIVMMNRKVWVEYGPPGKGTRVLTTD